MIPMEIGSMDSRIGDIGHPHWYRPRPENTDVPLVSKDEVEEAYYKISRNLNKISYASQVQEETLRYGEPPKLPYWCKKYEAPPPQLVNGTYNMSRAQMAETMLHLHGEPFRFNRWNEQGVYENRRYLQPIYNMEHNKIFFMCGRQVEKTQTLGNIMTISSIASPYYKALYVSPSLIQTQTFSSEKLAPLIERSPLIANYFVNSKCRRKIYDKSFANGSYIFLRSAFFNADRVRGISAYMFAGDEVQDQLTENLEVISECLAHAPFPRWVFACTPKTLDNTAASYWERSRKGEWFVPCQAHGTPKDPASWYWQPLGMKNIGKKGLICRKPGCGKPIDARFGEWRWTGDPKAEWAGFRISQLMVPWVPWVPAPNAPPSILGKYNDYSQAKFYNEVLGLPFDDSEKPITREDLHKCCVPDRRNVIENLDLARSRGLLIVGGGDWGTSTIKSYTLITFVVWNGVKWDCLYAKRYEGAEADYSFAIPDIIQILEQRGVAVSGFDQGIGFAQNDQIGYAIHGAINVPYQQRRIFPILYMGASNEVMRWKDEQQCYHLNRTKSMNFLFQMIKRQEVSFPCWDDMHKPFFEDILHVHKEVRTSTQRGESIMYSKNPDLTDDFCHALNFAIQTGMALHGMV